MTLSHTVRTLLLAIIIVAASYIATAQQHRPLPSTRIKGAMEQLQSLTSVLYVAAHPDDENTRLLAWLARGKNIRTGYLSITRGDGGQNIIGPEQGAALGLIRTHELLAARNLDGAEQYFGRAVDFGFSKNSDETFRQWNARQLVADVVWIYRRFRPDVVICRFPTDSMAGHGQHSASAIIAHKAFDLSGNAGSFPEHATMGALPWKPTRLLFNSFRFGSRSTVKPNHFRLDVGQFDATIGMGYGELAGISRSIHRSQGAGTPSTPGVQPEYFETIAGSAPVRGLFDGIDTTWNRVQRPDIGMAIAQTLSAFNIHAPHLSIPALVRIRRLIATVQDTFWRQQKLQEVDNIIASCCGITADVTVPQRTALAGEQCLATVRVVARAGSPITMVSAAFPNGTSLGPVLLQHDSLVVQTHSTAIPAGTLPTQPYWLFTESVDNIFVLRHDSLAGRSVSPPLLPVPLTFDVMGEKIVLTVPLSSKRLDPLRGDVIEELRIIPPVSVEPTELVVHRAVQSGITVRVRAHVAIADAKAVVSLQTQTLKPVSGITLRASTDTLIVIPLPATGNGPITVGIEVGGTVYHHAVRTIAYDHLPTIQYLQSATVTVIDDTLRTTAQRIGFVRGAGEYTPEYLRSLGCIVTELSDEQLLRTEELLAYDAILVGIRAINTRPSMKFLMPALLSYVERGGTLVMQYNTTQDMSTSELGPFPIALGRSRTTEENATVSILNPEHPVLNAPNRITASDFEGWVQERGLYFPASWSNQYVPLLAMADTGEPNQRGSLLVAQYGAGHYIYCSLSLFRQLPAGVKGASKLLLNMLSAGR